uniref:ACT domain-containing protein n=1 Tax=Picea sitchensis TaxID=3332 RepID=D5A8U1_PICSI|nr:unknown [Picea sitchensis]
MQIQSANKHGILLDIVQVLVDFDLLISKAYISSDGVWVMDVFHVTDSDGNKVTDEGLIDHIQQGTRLELCRTDQIGPLSDATRIFRENGLSVTRADITSRDEKGVDVFYVTDVAGNFVDSKTVEAIRQEIGKRALQVKESSMHVDSSPQESSAFSFGDLFKSQSERFLYNIGFKKSDS